MGDIADMMLDGSMCQWCGEILEGDGYPTVCPACQKEHHVNHLGIQHEEGKPRKPQKVRCGLCGRRVKEVGLAQHMKDKHGHRA